MNHTHELKYGFLGASLSIASFGITFVRLGLIIYTSGLILTGLAAHKPIIIGMILLIMMLDYYDGKLFNKSYLQDIAHWRIKRRLLDSISDRMVIQIGCLSLLLIDPSFLIFYLAILAREVLNCGYPAWMYQKKGILIYPKRIARVTGLLVGLTVIGYLTFGITATAVVTVTMLLMSFFAFKECQNSFKEHENRRVPADRTPGEIVEIL